MVVLGHAGLGQRLLKGGGGQGVAFPHAGAHVLHRDGVVHRLVVHHQVHGGLGAAVKGRHVVQRLRLRVSLAHRRGGGLAHRFQLGFFRQGLGAAKHPRGQVHILFAVHLVLFLDQADAAAGPVDQRGLVRFGRAGQKRPLGAKPRIPGVAQRAGLVGVAGLVVQLQHAQPGHAPGQKIHHRQVAGGDGRVLQHLLKDHAGDAAGQVDEILVALQFLSKGRIGQKIALAAVVGGKGLFQAYGEILGQVGVQVGLPVRQKRLRRAGVQNVIHDPFDVQLHVDSPYPCNAAARGAGRADSLSSIAHFGGFW